MKAKVKATGKVVEAVIDKCSVPVSGYGAKFVYDCSDGKKYFDTELDFINVYPNWEQIRIQSAICAMQGLCSNPVVVQQFDYNERAEVAVKQADSLIEELKKRNGGEK
jgi:hypothetical protein